jgi:hypothetical protein
MFSRKKFNLPAMLLAGGFAFISCSEPGTIGIEVQPEGDKPGVYVTDTLTVEAETIREDSLRSDEGVAAFNLAGSYTDPVFGLSRASFYTQVRLPNNNASFTFGTDPVLDSVVLTLAYSDFYGDTLTPMFAEVYQLDEALFIDSNYYTNDALNLGPVLFAGNISVRPKDSVEVNGAKRAPHLRLRLDDSFGTGFLSSPTSNFSTNETFIQFFKGLHVKTADVTGTGEGVIMSFNLLAGMSKLTFYYTNSGDTTKRSASFEINNNCPRFNRYEHDYSLAEFGAGFPFPGTQRLYVQSMAGVKVRLKFPYLKNFSANGPVSVNKAELIIPVTDNTTYKNHQNMLIFGVDEKGSESVIPDLLESLNYYGGAYSALDNHVTFSLNRYVQQVLSGRIQNDYGLSLIASGGAFNAFRTVVPGTSAPGARLRLKLTYTKLN